MQRNLTFNFMGGTWIATLMKVDSIKTDKDGVSQPSLCYAAQTLDLAGTYQVFSHIQYFAMYKHFFGPNL